MTPELSYMTFYLRKYTNIGKFSGFSKISMENKVDLSERSKQKHSICEHLILILQIRLNGGNKNLKSVYLRDSLDVQ